MPNQLPYFYNQNWDMNVSPNSFSNQMSNQSILYKINELEERIKELESKLNGENKFVKNETYDFKTSMHMM